jgi:hypothetical protein
MDLERELRALHVDWPDTPSFASQVERRRRRRPAAAAAVALAAVALALAVPQSRGAILRFFDIGSVRVQVVDTLPAAQEQPLGEGLGSPVSPAAARHALPQLLVPRLDPLPVLRLASGEFVSLLFAYRGHPVLLSEFGSGFYLKKLVTGETSVESVAVRGGRGVWLSGGDHVVFLNRSPRLAGSVLLWATDRATYRLEGPQLTKADALALADSLRRG